MEEKIQLRHPQGKKAVRISKEKYDRLKALLVAHLRKEESATLGNIAAAMKNEFRKRRTTFEGSLPWYLEWVKLDLEARKIITRVAGTSPQKYRIRG
jgi:hypothetical protein